MEKNKFVSIVIPCYNEEGNIGKTLDGLLDLINKHKYSFEIIVVNDGIKIKVGNNKRYASSRKR
jgi:glycosyltransferase involved in cell wall biosynthesis